MIFPSNRKIGSDAEDLAGRYLKTKGFKILEKNYTIRGGEIDIVAIDRDFLVFVEVKARFSREYGLPQEAITPWKIKSLKKTALFFITQKKLDKLPCRFDLLAMDFSSNRQKPIIELIENII